LLFSHPFGLSIYQPFFFLCCVYVASHIKKNKI
jgi:hypothetical protein